MELNEESLTVLRKKIKAYESQFKSTNNRKPSKDDIDADAKMRKYYKLYWKYCSVRGKSPSTPKVCQSKPLGNSVWSNSLNKQPQTKNTSVVTGDRVLDRFLTLSGKLQQMNEQHHFEEGKAERQLKYSLAFKRRQQLEKSKQINSELLVKKQAEASKRRNQEEHVSLTYDNDNSHPSVEASVLPEVPMIQSFDRVVASVPPKPISNLAQTLPPVPDAPQETALSLLESLSKGGGSSDTVNNGENSASFDVDQDFYFDNVNDYIKNVILTDDPPEKPKPAKRSIYDLDDDPLFSSSKTGKVSSKYASKQTRKFFSFTENETDTDLITDTAATTSIASTSTATATTSTTSSSVTVKKKSTKKVENYRRLNMKKKSFARGHKKLNMKNYKFKTWKKNKAKRKFDNNCFKCGAPDHFANVCPSNEFLNESKYLKVDEPKDIVSDIASNIVLTVSKTNNKLTSLVELLKREPFKSLKSIIIYCTKREQTTHLETQIRTLMQFDLPKGKMSQLVRAYHAGLSIYEKASIQEQFISGKLRIIVATVAFGMGINKPDIRGIIHYCMPKSFESYVQEVGRAGGDGQTAYCHLFLDNEGEDLFNLQSYIYANGLDKPSIRRLVAKIYQPCKCNLLAAMVDRPSEEEDPKVHRSTCSGHPVALPIAPTEMEIDLKSERIYSLLNTLEQSYPAAPIHVHSQGNSIATVVNFGDEADMYDVVKQSAILQMGATLANQSNKSAFTFSEFSFSFVKVAAMLSLEVQTVRSELSNLEWTTDPVTNRKKRSHISIRFGDYAYLLKAPGNLTENDIEEVCTFLTDTVEQYEAKEIFKLRFLYSKFSEFIIEDFIDQQAVVANSDNIKHFINEYFSSANPCPLPLDFDSSKLTLPRYFNLANQDIDAITLVIRDFISLYYAEGVNTPRKIARILQGISSPKYPAEIWGQVRRFWRCLPTIDFKHLLELCRQELINNYSLPSN